jgi:hypothetical protein
MNTNNKIFTSRISFFNITSKYSGFINIIGGNTIDKKVTSVITDFILEDEIFKLKKSIATTLTVTDETVLYNYNSDIVHDGWYLHPILIKSLLRYLDTKLTKIQKFKMARPINTIYNTDAINNCSLISMAEDVKLPSKLGDMSYRCNGILNEDDMFNDDHLIIECTKHLIKKSLDAIIPKCLFGIIFEYIT